VKNCPSCKQVKEDGEFYLSKASGKLCSYCKKCQSEKYKNYIDNNPAARQRRNKRSADYRAINGELVRYQIKNATYKKKYNVTYDFFLELLDKQEHKCAICEKKILCKRFNNHDRAVLDHCHSTGKVRAVLCHMCNAAIGLLREDKSLVKKALEYLEYHDKQ